MAVLTHSSTVREHAAKPLLHQHVSEVPVLQLMVVTSNSVVLLSVYGTVYHSGPAHTTISSAT